MNAIIFHGTLGTPDGNWFRWLAHELSKVGFSTAIPAMPTPEGQSLSAWFDKFNSLDVPVTNETILVGHSSGAVFCMRLLEKLLSPVKCVALVAPPYKKIGHPEIDTLNSSFLAAPFDWAKIKANASNLTYLMGDNDQYVPQEQLYAIAKNLEVEPIVIPGGGHLNAETGYTTFPVLLESIKNSLNERTLSSTPDRAQ